MQKHEKLERMLGAAVVAGCLLSGEVAEAAQFRFPRPDFKSGYSYKQEINPAARSDAMEWVDVGVLVAMILVASYFALKKRSRRWLMGVSALSLFYFGFYRKGCVCPVGSIQNVALALFDRAYAIPMTIVFFFAIPLFMTLLFGRTFCAAVCPLGAAQDMVVVKPMRVPFWLDGVLGLIPHLYLAVGVLMAATGAGFVICRLDPFVGLFRLGAHVDLLELGLFFLALGMFVGRPYCRYVCPYGVLLGWFSKLSWRHLAITPDMCVNCRLCEDSCPFGAIRMPGPARYPETRAVGVRRLALALWAVPALALAGALLGSKLEAPLSMAHKDVKLAEDLKREDEIGKRGETIETETFRSQGRAMADLEKAALAVRHKFVLGGGLVGGYMGLMVALKLYGLSVRRTRKFYEIERESCVSCGRCFLSCPKEHDRLAKLGAA